MSTGRNRFARVPIAAASARLGAGAHRVLIAICIHADPAGMAWPSFTTISALTGIVAANIPREITLLEQAGLLKRCGWQPVKAGRARRYQVIYSEAYSSPETTTEAGDKSSPETTTWDVAKSSVVMSMTDAPTSSGVATTGTGGKSSPPTTSSPVRGDLIGDDDLEAFVVVSGEDQTAQSKKAHRTAHTDPCLKPPVSLFAAERATASADGKTPAAAKAAAADLVREFEDSFWPLVPKRTEKAAALKQFITARKKKKVPLETLVAAMARCARQFEPAGPTSLQYAKNPAGWLLQERWEDELPPPSNGIKPHPPHQRAPPANGGGHLGAVMRFYQTTQFDEDNADE